jgi:hypothetical protein
MARNPHEPTKGTRDTVTLHTLVGTRQEVICQILGISEKTLRKHYRNELDTALAQANATIGGKLFNKAKDGDSAAMMFWLKTRAGFRERQEIDHTSSDGSMTPCKKTLDDFYSDVPAESGS